MARMSTNLQFLSAAPRYSVHSVDSAAILEESSHTAQPDAGALFSARLRRRTWIAMHDAMRDDANVGILIARDWFPASHAAREHRIDRTRHLVERRVVGAGGDVHGSLSYT